MKNLFITVGIVPLEKGLFDDDLKLFQTYAYTLQGIKTIKQPSELKYYSEKEGPVRSMKINSSDIYAVEPDRSNLYLAWRHGDVDYLESVKECIEFNGLDATVAKLAEKTAYMDAMIAAVSSDNQISDYFKELKGMKDGAYRVTFMNLIPSELVELFKSETDPKGLDDIKSIFANTIKDVMDECKIDDSYDVRIGFNIYPIFTFDIINTPEEVDRMEELKRMATSITEALYGKDDKADKMLLN